MSASTLAVQGHGPFILPNTISSNAQAGLCCTSRSVAHCPDGPGNADNGSAGHDAEIAAVEATARETEHEQLVWPELMAPSPDRQWPLSAITASSNSNEPAVHRHGWTETADEIAASGDDALQSWLFRS